MTEAEPRVSTELSFLIMAWCLAMRCTPRARARTRTTVRMAVSPSGTAAAARETAVRRESIRSWRYVHDGQSGQSQNLRYAGHLLLERCGFLLGLVQHAGDATHLGAHASGGHHHPAGTLGYGGAVEDHVGPIAQGDGPVQPGGAFAHGQGFTRHAQDEGMGGGGRERFVPASRGV